MRSLMVAFALALVLAGCSDPRHDAMVFSAWCKLHQCGDLTVAEWKALKSEELLPGQCPADDTDDYIAVTAGAAAGMAAGAAGRRR